MAPRWQDGDLIEFRIHPADAPLPVGKDVHVKRPGGAATFKRLASFDKDAGELVLKSANVKYPNEIRVALADVERIGVALHRLVVPRG
ncbi:MAG TPA: hypothetical protein VFC78_15345 [Tepidisphaeraceae bacterium]|nr:hypothetical protein [Tepidisphaeraceae bacterium]